MKNSIEINGMSSIRLTGIWAWLFYLSSSIWAIHGVFYIINDVIKLINFIKN